MKKAIFLKKRGFFKTVGCLKKFFFEKVEFLKQ